MDLEKIKTEIKHLYKQQIKLLYKNYNLQELNKINAKIYELRQLYKAEKMKQRQSESQQTAKTF